MGFVCSAMFCVFRWVHCVSVGFVCFGQPRFGRVCVFRPGFCEVGEGLCVLVGSVCFGGFCVFGWLLCVSGGCVRFGEFQRVLRVWMGLVCFGRCRVFGAVLCVSVGLCVLLEVWRVSAMRLGCIENAIVCIYVIGARGLLKARTRDADLLRGRWVPPGASVLCVRVCL